MKKILSLILLLVVIITTKAQFTDYPQYEKKKPWSTDVRLSLIAASEDDITIYLIISGSYNFNSETYLEYTNPANGNIEKVYMKDARREVGETARYFASYGYDKLSLIFPPLPNGVNKLNLISSKVKLYGISINPIELIKKEERKRIATSEDDIKEIIENSNIKIAGFYEGIKSPAYKLAILKDLNSIYAVYIGESGYNNNQWVCGEIKAILHPTAITGMYKAEWYGRNFIKSSAVITFDAVSMTVSFEDENEAHIYVRMNTACPESNNIDSQSELWSGTGYAIAPGYIVTNNHVVGEAKTITIKGVKGDINIGYSAEVVATDKVNDIAIIKINDANFKGFGQIPYAIQQRMADVGEDVFVLGYPLTQALGNEIKLTNGIVSSRTGYQGDIATYQISAPIQPGNSGGPMFDSKGNVIGIVVAGVPGADNVGYAIKTSYLKILIESAGLSIKFPANNTISTLSLAEKVKKLKNFVYYIECSK